MNISTADRYASLMANFSPLARRQKQVGYSLMPTQDRQATKALPPLFGQLSQPTVGAERRPNVVDKPLLMDNGAIKPAPLPQAKPKPSEAISVSDSTATGTKPNQGPLTLEQIQHAWGTNDPHCDLDGNGTVDINDLVAFVLNLPAPQPPTPAAATPLADPTGQRISPTTNADTSAGVSPASNLHGSTKGLSIEGFRKAWGQSGSPYDLNGDNTVNMDDLVQYITSLSAPDSGGVDKAAADQSNGRQHVNAAASSKNPDSTKVVAELVDSLIDRLNQAGFEKQPPTNIHNLVDALQLSPDQSKSVVGKLQARYPDGLGINLKA